MKKNVKKKEQKVQRKGNYSKRAREEIIKLRWHMANIKTKFFRKVKLSNLVDKNLKLVAEYFKPECSILFGTFQGL